MEVQMTATATASATVLRRDALVVFAGLLVVMFLGALDQTIMATALPTIAGDLGGLSELTWVVTVYVLAAAATTPVWGKLSDLLGRRELLRIALAMFLVASALSGLAQGIGELIAFRALQGAAAGGLMTLAMATVGDIVAPRERGRYQGYIQAVFVLASVAGPLLGGVSSIICRGAGCSTSMCRSAWRRSDCWAASPLRPVNGGALESMCSEPSCSPAP